MPPLPVRIRLYPEPGHSLYFVAVIWPTQREMRAAYPGPQGKRTTGAFCACFTKERYRDGRKRTLPIVGEVHFARNYLGMETIAHELMHAALGWARRVGLDYHDIFLDKEKSDACPDEERLSYAHGRMVRQLVDRLYKLGMYD